LSLYLKGYRYYTNSISGFGKDMLVKVVETKEVRGKLMCVCVNTINMQFTIPATEVLLVEGK
jgi:hypothetical protein